MTGTGDSCVINNFRTLTTLSHHSSTAMSTTLYVALGQEAPYLLRSVPNFLSGALKGCTSITFRQHSRLSGNLNIGSAVYDGKLEYDADDSIYTVCKIILNEDSDRLEAEASLYIKQLNHLQGTTVPRFYGLFRGRYINTFGRERDIRCIILESCGSPITNVLHKPMKFRYAANGFRPAS